MPDRHQGDGSRLYQAIQHVAMEYAEKIAIECEGRAISYGDLINESQSFCEMIVRSNADPICGLLVGNPINFMIAYLGLAASRRKIVLLDPRHSPAELLAAAAELGFRTVVTSPVEAGLLGNSSDFELETTAGATFSIFATSDGNRTLDRRYVAEDFVVHCTSGSTGRPKGIVLSESNVLARVDSWCRTLDIGSHDVLLCTLTLAHCHGIEIIMLPGLMRAATVVAPELASLTPKKIAALIADHHVTIFSSLPFIYDLILEVVKPEEASFESVRLFVSASAPLPISTAVSFRQRFGRPLHQAYGLSEIGGICFNRSAAEPDLIGEPAYGLDWRLEPQLGVDHGHELVVRGPGLARGYLNPDDQGMFRDGWLWTKDIVEQKEGGLRVIGRVSRFINSGGNKIIPQEVEDQIRLCASVADVVVAGQQDPVEGEKVVAFIQWRAAPNPAEVRNQLAGSLASYKMPREIITVSDMPRGSIGKIAIRELLDLESPSRSSQGPGGPRR